VPFSRVPHSRWQDQRLLTYGIIIVVLFAGPTRYADGNDTKSVLILYSNESFLPANIALGNALVAHTREALAGRVELYSEFLDLVRFPGDAHQKRTADVLRDKYRGRHFDLIVTAGPQALNLLADHSGSLFPDVPVVFTAVREDNNTFHRLENATGILMRLDPMPTLELAIRLQPQTRRVVVVSGASDFDRSWHTVARERFHDYERRLEFTYLSALPTESLVKELQRLQHDTVVIFLTAFTDGAGQYMLSADAAKLVANASAVPVYGPYDTYLGTGIVGGCVDTFEHVGRETAKLGLRVLAGESPKSITPYLPGEGVTVIDSRQMSRWGLREDRLPSHAERRFKEPSLWEEHRGTVLGTLAVVTLQSALLLALLIQRRNRIRAELEVDATRRELTHAARLATVGELTASIAHEINQPLGAILSNADAAEMLLDSSTDSTDEVRQILEDIRQDDLRASEVIKRLRTLLRNRAMEMQSIDVHDLIADVLRLIRSEGDRRGVIIHTQLASGTSLVRGDRVHLQQVLLNLLLNGMEAMMQVDGAKELVVRTQRITNAMEIAVSDSGPGISAETHSRLFDPFVTTKKEGMGLGLSIARTLVEAHGGRIWADNQSGTGATFRFTVPFAAPSSIEHHRSRDCLSRELTS
jgi:signal transduction histidine kinase